ncbi:homocysteine S-methyltransferase family protein [Aestuariivirga litoralis]|uniref:homocysteine S-methyltransferase family protein n=1 Tax=Aestuariivirga litoralis TaxID=2650924 RepID=UPI0018C76F0D|nr:homocysteine S-methyltransferase family protein [Aestuariivirga litoralis]MBG1231925.1 homocysteine S-methyltransferase family protein [Aestuariivirga litoralis]
MSYAFIAEKLKAGLPIILDGGTGTDIERRGAPMSTATWCADVNATHGNIVREVHADYVKAGADIIAANTFATSMLSFDAYGRADEALALDAVAVGFAKEAAKGRKVAVAGSFSTQRPVIAGTDRTNMSRSWTRDEAKALFKRKADNLKALGVDLIMMEMMRDTDYSLWACEAAMEMGLPVWIGISVERVEGELVGFGRTDQKLSEIAPALAALKPAAMCIMHTSANDTDEALQILRKSFSGPIGAYPECGYYKAPNWVFEDVISPEDLIAKSHDWQKLGASIFGGCCGIGPTHIKALATEFAS